MRLSLLTRLEEIHITPADIVRGALNLLTSDRKWAKGVFLARDIFGKETTALHHHASSWTLLGSLRRAATELGVPSDEDWAPVLWQTYELVERHLPVGHASLLTFNNHPWTEFEDVREVLSSTLTFIERKESATRFSQPPQAEAAAA